VAESLGRLNEAAERPGGVPCVRHTARRNRDKPQPRHPGGRRKGPCRRSRRTGAIPRHDLPVVQRFGAQAGRAVTGGRGGCRERRGGRRAEIDVVRSGAAVGEGVDLLLHVRQDDWHVAEERAVALRDSLEQQRPVDARAVDLTDYLVEDDVVHLLLPLHLRGLRSELLGCGRQFFRCRSVLLGGLIELPHRAVDLPDTRRLLGGGRGDRCLIVESFPSLHGARKIYVAVSR